MSDEVRPAEAPAVKRVGFRRLFAKKSASKASFKVVDLVALALEASNPFSVVNDALLRATEDFAPKELQTMDGDELEAAVDNGLDDVAFDDASRETALARALDRTYQSLLNDDWEGMLQNDARAQTFVTAGTTDFDELASDAAVVEAHDVAVSLVLVAAPPDDIESLRDLAGGSLVFVDGHDVSDYGGSRRLPDRPILFGFQSLAKSYRPQRKTAAAKTGDNARATNNTTLVAAYRRLVALCQFYASLHADNAARPDVCRRLDALIGDGSPTFKDRALHLADDCLRALLFLTTFVAVDAHPVWRRDSSRASFPPPLPRFVVDHPLRPRAEDLARKLCPFFEKAAISPG